MSTIPNSLPSLATALMDLSSQTAPGSQKSASLGNITLPDTTGSGGADTLDLSPNASSQLQAAQAQVAQQNSASTLADSAAALTANNSAIAFIGEDPDLTQSAQSSPTAASVLSLLS